MPKTIFFVLYQVRIQLFCLLSFNTVAWRRDVLPSTHPPIRYEPSLPQGEQTQFSQSLLVHCVLQLLDIRYPEGVLGLEKLFFLLMNYRNGPYMKFHKELQEFNLLLLLIY